MTKFRRRVSDVGCDESPAQLTELINKEGVVIATILRTNKTTVFKNTGIIEGVKSNRPNKLKELERVW